MVIESGYFAKCDSSHFHNLKMLSLLNRGNCSFHQGYFKGSATTLILTT